MTDENTPADLPSAGDRDRQRLVVREITACQSTLYAYICSLLGTSHGAADVLQEANLVLWEKAGEYDPDRSFLPWAYRIAYFQVMAYRKKRSREKLTFDDELIERISDAFRRRDEGMDRQLEALDGCMNKLPQKHRAVVDARYRDGESLDVIAGRVGKAPNAVAAELYRLRKVLMECIRTRLATEEGA